jgi:hypothetical protein
MPQSHFTPEVNAMNDMNKVTDAISLRHPDPRLCAKLEVTASSLQIRGSWKKLQVKPPPGRISYPITPSPHPRPACSLAGIWWCMRNRSGPTSLLAGPGWTISTSSPKRGRVSSRHTKYGGRYLSRGPR